MRSFGIAVGKGTSPSVRNISVTWEKFCDQFAQVEKISDKESAGHFIGGQFANDYRNEDNLLFRSMLTIDIDKYPFDYASLEFDIEMAVDYAFLCYETFSSTDEAPRVRVVIPLSRDVSANEYRALSKAYCAQLGIEGIDGASYVPSTLMFRPSSEDGSGRVFNVRGDMLDVDSFDLVVVADDDDFEIDLGLDVERPSEAHFLAALDAIDNDGEGLEYDTWFDVLCGIKNYYADNVDRALEVAREFTARSTKSLNPKKNFDKTWKSIHPHRHGSKLGTTFNKVLGMARDAGWNDDVMAIFEEEDSEDVPAVVEDSEDTGRLTTNSKGRFENTANNCQLAVSRQNIIGMTIAYDHFSDEIKFSRAGEPWQRFGDAELFEIRTRMDRMGFLDTSVEKTRGAVHFVAMRNCFDSAQDWIDTIKWDGVSRVETFCSRYLGAEDTPYTRGVAKYLWTAMAGRVRVPGIKCDMAPVLVSPEGRYKSSAIREMVPHEDLYAELNIAKNDDDIARQMRGKLLAEWPELGGVGLKDEEHIKAFMTKRVEEWTPKFKEFTTRYPRRSIIIGTTNVKRFLTSTTGNRRFLPMTIAECDTDAIKRDREQLWAEADVLFGLNGVMWQEAHALGKEHQDNHLEVDEWTPIVENWLSKPCVASLDDDFEEGINADRDNLSNKRIAELALGVNGGKLSWAEGRRLTKVMERLGYSKAEKTKSVRGEKDRFYQRDGGQG